MNSTVTTILLIGSIISSMLFLECCQIDKKTAKQQFARLELGMPFENIIYEVKMGTAKEAVKRHSSDKIAVKSSRSLNSGEYLAFFSALELLQVRHWKRDYGTGPDDGRTAILSWRLLYNDGSCTVTSQGVGAFPSDHGVGKSIGPDESRLFRKMYDQFYKVTHNGQ